MKHLLVSLSVVLALVAGACKSDSSAGGSYRRPPDEPWRAQRPAAGPAPEFKLPTVQKAELKNGLTLLLIEEHSLPTLDVAVIVRAGSMLETTKEAGLASLAYDMLDEGAGGMSQLELANKLSQLGSSVQTSARADYGVIGAQLLKKHADAGLEILAAIVEKPAFAQADFDRIKAQHLAAVKARQGDPGEVASTITASLVFGGDHPYGHDADGTVASLEKLTAARAKKFWTDNAGPKNAALVIVGDITLDEAKALAEKRLGKWKGAAKAPKAPADPKERTAVTLGVVDVPGAPQTSIRIGRAVMARGDAEEAALIVMNEVLGGSFSSRINLKLREEKQWTYGAFSMADRRLGKGPMLVMTDVQTPATADAVAELLAQLDVMVQSGVTDAELAFAKESWTKSLPGLYGLPPVQVGALAQLFAYNLPETYLADLAAKVGAVTLDDVKKVAARALKKEDLVVVLVGDKATFEAKLKEKGLPDAQLFLKDGAPAK